jgi:transcriptional regulator with XRE-family HTH domain
MADIFEIGETIKRARRDLRLSQSELSEVSGVSRGRIDALENGRVRDMGYDAIHRLMRALDLDIMPTSYNHGRPTLDELTAENRFKDLVAQRVPNRPR